MLRPLDVATVRRRFPGLARCAGDRQTVFLDGPAGSQVPESVADAMRSSLLYVNANHGGAFATSNGNDAMVDEVRRAVTDFLGARDPEEIVFGANMTTLTFHLARQLARTWRAGDEIVVTDSDHDANVTPWVLAARDAGCTVRRIRIDGETRFDLQHASEQINDRTRLVAVGSASNLSGTIQPVREIVGLARHRGALTFVDAVHHAPHLRLDVEGMGCDFLACSAYKFFGPHLGVLWGRRTLLEEIEVDKVRPAPEHGPEKWQTGTANFEAIAGVGAAIGYLAALGTQHGGAQERRRALDTAFQVIEAYEGELCARLLRGLAALPGLRVVGIDDPTRIRERCPTVSFVSDRVNPPVLARQLAERQICCWSGNSYAIALSESLGLEPEGVLRLGILHYNTADEIDDVLGCLGDLLGRGTTDSTRD